MTDVSYKISGKITRLRKQGGYKSADDFAKEAGIHRATYYRLESGLNNFTMKTLLSVLEVHNMTLSEFFSDINH